MERSYELVVILDPETKGEEQEKLLTKIKSFITDAEGKVLKSTEWGKKEFSFPLKKRKSGLYYLFSISISSDKTQILKQKFTLEDKILRYLLTVEEPAFVKTTARQGR